MTVAQLVVEIEARNRSFKTVLADSSRGVNAFVREVEKANQKIAALQIEEKGIRAGQMFSPNPGQLQLVQRMTKEIIDNYKAADKELRKAFRAGGDPAEFIAKGKALAEATVKGARKQIEEQRSVLGNDVANALIGSIEGAVTKSQHAVEKGARNINQVQRALDDLDAARDRALRKLDTDIGEGRVAAAERTLKRAEIAAQRNEALVRKLNELEAKGQSRPSIREAALTKLDPAGFGVGFSRTEAEKVFQDAERQIGHLQQRLQTEIARTKLDLAAGLDPRVGEQRIIAAYEAMNRGVEHGRQRLRAAKTLTPEMEQLLSGALVKVPKAKINLTPLEQAFLDAQRQVKRLQERFQTDVARTKLDLAAGLDPRVGEQRIIAAYEAMNRGIEHGRQRLRAADTLTPEVERLLSGALVKIPEAKLNLSPIEKTFQDAQRQVARLRDRFQTEIARTKLDLAAGLDPKVGEQRIIAAYEGLNRGIEHGRRRLDSAKLLTPELEQLLSGALVNVPKAKLNLSPVQQTFSDAKRQIGRLQSNLQQEIARAKLDFTAGFIDAGTMNKRIDTAFTTLQRGIEHGRGRLRAGNVLTGEIESEMAKAVEAAGRAVNRSRVKVVDEGVNLARLGVTKFKDAYNAAIGQAKLKTTTGEIDSKGFTKAANAARASFNKELDALRRDLDARGLLTPAAARLIDRQFQRAGQQAATSFGKALALAKSDQTVRALSEIGRSATTVGRQLTFGLTVPLAGVGAASLKLAADAQQSQRRMQQLFGPLSLDFGRQLRALQKEVPATTAELNQMAARFGELLIPIGIAPAKIAEMSKELIIASKNIGVFAGVNSERSMNAIINALIGQSRELKKLGISIDDASIKDEAYRIGIARVGETLSATQKALAAYNVIINRSKVVAGTLTEQQDTLNVRFIFFQKSLKEAGITLGTTLIPAAQRVLDALTQMVNGFANTSEATRTFYITLAGIAIVLGPVLVALGSFVRTLAAVRTAMLALKAVELAGGAAASGGALVSLLGITGATIATIIGAAGALAILADRLDKIGRFTGLSANFTRSLKEMTSAELAHAATQNRLDQARVQREREALKRQAGIVDTPLGPIFGGTSKERKDFTALGETLKQLKAEGVAINEEWTKLDSQQLELNRHTAEWEAQIKATQDAANGKLLISTLREVRAEYGRIASAARNARASITTGLKTNDPELLAEGIQKSEEALNRISGLLDRVKTMQTDEEFAPLGKDLGKLISDLGTVELGLKRVLNTSQKSTELVSFARDVRVAIAELTNDQAAGRDITQPLERVNELAAETAKRMRAIKVDDKTMDTLKLIAVQLETAARNAAKVDIGGLTSRVALELEKLRDLTERSKDATGGERAQVTQDLFTQLVQVAAVEKEINDMIALGVGTAKQRNTLQERLIELKRAERAANEQLITGVDIFLPGLRETLSRQADKLKDAQVTLDVQLRIPDNEAAIRQAKKAVSRIQQEIGESLRDALSGGMFELLDDVGQADVMRQVDALMKQLGIDGQTFNEELERTDKILDRISIGLRGIGEIFEAFGVEAKNAREMVRNANLVVNAFKQIQAARKAAQDRQTDDPFDTSRAFRGGGFNFQEIVGLISGIAGVIGGAIGLITTLSKAFGKSEREREHDDILKKNNDKLEELASEISKFTLSIGNQAKVIRAIQDPTVRRGVEAVIEAQKVPAAKGSGTEQRQRNLEAALARFGLTLADINRVAKENGIEILDKKGRIVAGTFDQLAKAIGFNIAMLTTYGNTLADQTSALDLRNDVFDIEQTPAQIIKDQVGLLAKLAPELFEQFFAGVDLNDVQAVENANRALTTALLSGALDLSKFGDLFDKSDLERIILGVESGLDKFGEGLDKATESVLNVPSWFKTNQARFLAVDPDIPKNIPTTEPPAPFTPTVPGPPPGVRPVGSLTQNNTFNIYQQPGEDTDAFADRVIERMRNEKFLRTGSTRLDGFDE